MLHQKTPILELNAPIWKKSATGPRPLGRMLGLTLLLNILFTWYTPAVQPAQATASLPASLPPQAYAGNPGSITGLPSLEDFRRSVMTDRRGELAGVYVSGVLAYPVVQQPAREPGYVSDQSDTITQFSLAARHGTVGLLAHNYLAGEIFYNLEIGQQVTLVYGDGNLRYFLITSIDQFQSLTPNSPYSDFRELTEDAPVISVGEVFDRIYAPGNRVVFQTCIEAYGDSSWGRMFVTAVPLKNAGDTVKTSWLLRNPLLHLR